MEPRFVAGFEFSLPMGGIVDAGDYETDYR